MTEAIPRPWAVEGWSIVRDTKEVRLRHLIIDDVRTADVSNEQAVAHAALIVRAANSHDALVGALDWSLGFVPKPKSFGVREAELYMRRRSAYTILATARGAAPEEPTS